MGKRHSEEDMAAKVLQRFQERLAAEGKTDPLQPMEPEDEAFTQREARIEAIVVTPSMEASYAHLSHMDYDNRIRRIKESELHRMEEEERRAVILAARTADEDANFRRRMGPTAEALVDALLPDLGFSLRESRIEAVLSALKPLDERLEALEASNRLY